MPPEKKSLERELQDKINKGEHLDVPLQTDERVLHRVTDGIYRQPASALRELIANAYDADATEVTIRTDAPRFNTITVKDNGTGMDVAILANLIKHIGGSAKRTSRGVDLGVTGNDPRFSKGGRKLIGKIGIGLFSVAQLTRQFTIVTKRAGTNYQLMAHVTLNRFEEYAESEELKDGGSATTDGRADEADTSDAAEPETVADEIQLFEAGTARIWAEKTSDKRGQGTTITLTRLLPQTMDVLRSQDVWDAVADAEQDARKKAVPPLFHVGLIDSTDSSKLARRPKLPFKSSSTPRKRFEQFVRNVKRGYTKSNQYARLEFALDEYLRTVWILSLSLPYSYVGGHPFDWKSTQVSHVFELPEARTETKATAAALNGQSVRQVLNLQAASAADFQVIFDDIELSVPIEVSEQPKTTQAFQDPILFVGSSSPDMTSIDASQRGGDSLKFEGYLLWVPKLLPQEHNGVLIRINGASGTLFDHSFLRYPIAERRLGQIVGEIYVSEGLEGALNIDRESFNTAHPHYIVVKRWLHDAILKVRNTVKGLQATAQKERRENLANEFTNILEERVATLLAELGYDDPEDIADYKVADTDEAAEEIVEAGKKPLLRKPLEEVAAIGDLKVDDQLIARAAAIARLIDAYEILDEMDYADVADLVGSILVLADLDNKS